VHGRTKLKRMVQPAWRALLGRHPLLEGVESEHVDRFLDELSVKEVPRGMLLNTPGVAPGLLHLVLRGRLRAYQVAVDGRELLLELIQEGGFDGLLSVAGRRGHFTEADVDSAVVSLPMATLERLISVEPRIARNLLGLIIDRLEGREVQLEAIALHDPSQRLARQLLALGTTLGTKRGDWVVLKPRITHQMLADMLGIRRETVTLHLGRLTDLGAVKVQEGHLQIDTTALSRIVDYPQP
jgi:CRP/FNR family cyclic AMP-dependent transcriptional regulator